MREGLGPGARGHPPGHFTQQANTSRTQRITLVRNSAGYGFSIRGGSEHKLGIYVSEVEKGSEAHLQGLQVGGNESQHTADDCHHCRLSPLSCSLCFILVLSGWRPDPEGLRDASGSVHPQGGRRRHPEPQQGAAEGAQWWVDPSEESEKRATELEGSDAK